MKIVIGSQEYKVEYKETVTMDCTEVLGSISYNNNIIKVNKSLPRTKGDNVLLHECVHGMLREAQLEEDDNEILVQALANQLQMFLKNNKDLVLSLMKDEVE